MSGKRKHLKNKGERLGWQDRKDAKPVKLSELLKEEGKVIGPEAFTMREPLLLP